MDIRLKQTEIITALKQYLGSQGTQLVGKVVSIRFTAGRKEAGLSADISIEDDVAQATSAPAPIVVEAKVIEDVATPMTPFVEDVEGPIVDHSTEFVDTPKPKTSSLFN